MSSKNTPRVTVLRLGHRIHRDKRLTTHLVLAARAFGAHEAIYSGQKDPGLEKKIADVVARWGGPFKVRYEKDWLSLIRGWDGAVCHLTMYGVNFYEHIKEISDQPEILMVVGSEKVPGNLYRLANFNIAIGNQPHSEVSALAVFLDRIFEGGELYRRFEDARISIVPQERGKKIRITDISRGNE